MSEVYNHIDSILITGAASPVGPAGHNLLYDAALLPNLSIELAFNRQSLLIQGAWSW
ncbi:hypothetical protein AGMMS50239_20200 [Bacteroidia bacterium]|nr:hypothetical protein AGMMS50239_20200 [Bacteroidia bacterium]